MATLQHDSSTPPALQPGAHATVAPPALPPGATIALLAPSARFHHLFPRRIARCIAFLESQGYRVRTIYDADLPSSPLSHSVAARAAEFHAAFTDPSIKAIVCMIGGMSCNELLPALDPEVIRRNPKIFVGSSDITLLHHFLHGAGLRSFYGPSGITQLGEFPAPLAFTWQHFAQTLTSRVPCGALPRSPTFTDEFCDWEREPALIAAGRMVPRTRKPARGWQWLRPGSAEGALWGGCLPSVLQLLGTKWEVSYAGKVALLELPEGDAPGTGIPIERATWNLLDLRMRGVFDQIVGLVVGRPYLYTTTEEEAWEAELLRATEGHAFPILAGVDVGHTDPMLTVPLGARVRLDSARDEWVVLEAGVSHPE